jgi:hypothetical protein
MAVADVDRKPLDVELLPGYEPWLSGRIGIAKDGPNRCDGRKLIDDGATADVAGVEDQIDAVESGKDLRPYEAVRIRNQAEDE